MRCSSSTYRSSSNIKCYICRTIKLSLCCTVKRYCKSMTYFICCTCSSWFTNSYFLCTTSRWSYSKTTISTISKSISSISISRRFCINCYLKCINCLLNSVFSIITFSTNNYISTANNNISRKSLSIYCTGCWNFSIKCRLKSSNICNFMSVFCICFSSKTRS